MHGTMVKNSAQLFILKSINIGDNKYKHISQRNINIGCFYDARDEKKL